MSPFSYPQGTGGYDARSRFGSLTEGGPLKRRVSLPRTGDEGPGNTAGVAYPVTPITNHKEMPDPIGDGRHSWVISRMRIVEINGWERVAPSGSE